MCWLEREGLIAELVQNDLDQSATRRVISFERDRLVCEGHGRPVSGRLETPRSIQGAGDKVPAKSRRIGIKNHGLKTAFTIGDESHRGFAALRKRPGFERGLHQR